MASRNSIEEILPRLLREYPDEQFRLSLKEKLMQAATDRVSYKPEGFWSVTPYLIIPGASTLIDFLVNAFDATEKMRVPLASGALMHAEVRIGDSIIEMSDGSEQFPPSPTALHLYVPDADTAYVRALAAGATSLFAPADRPYGDREAGVKDPSGNYWYIATHKERPDGYTPENLHSVTPYLHAKGAEGQIRFLVEGLGGEELARYAAPDGSIMHAKVRIGDAMIELSEAHGEWQPMPASIHVHVPDCDAVYERALAAGGKTIHPLTDQPYGERSGGVLDPFGNRWWIATHTGKML